MEIREGIKEDMINIKQSLIDSWVDHAKQEPGLLDEERMRRSDIEGYYKVCFDSKTSDQHLILVAEQQGQFAGFARADLEQLHPFFTHNEIVFLDDVYVKSEFRSTGVAHQLIEQVEHWAKEKGVRRIQARVYTFNKSMQRILESMGYHSPHATWDKVLD